MVLGKQKGNLISVLLHVLVSLYERLDWNITFCALYMGTGTKLRFL
jgi:hypothetical protein